MKSLQKPEPYKKTKARRKRLDKEVQDETRAIVAARDGYCRLAGLGLGECYGAPERNHLRKKSQTRNQAPSVRHDPQESIMNCTRHHDLVDRRVIEFEYLSERKADGPIRFSIAGAKAVS